MNEYQQRTKDRAAEVAQALTRGLNVCGDGRLIGAIVEQLATSHRTLQQGVTRLCVAWLRHLARDCAEGRYDLRNEASCRLAYRLVGDLDDADVALPLI